MSLHNSSQGYYRSIGLSMREAFDQATSIQSDESKWLNLGTLPASPYELADEEPEPSEIGPLY